VCHLLNELINLLYLVVIAAVGIAGVGITGVGIAVHTPEGPRDTRDELLR